MPNNGMPLPPNSDAGRYVTALREAVSLKAESEQLEDDARQKTYDAGGILTEILSREYDDGREPVEYMGGRIEDLSHLADGVELLEALCKFRAGLRKGAAIEDKPVDREIVTAALEKVDRRIAELHDAGFFSYLDPQFQTNEISYAFRQRYVRDVTYHVADVPSLQNSETGRRLVESFRLARASTRTADGRDLVAIRDREIDGGSARNGQGWINTTLHRMDYGERIGVDDFIRDTRDYIDHVDAEDIKREQREAAAAAEAKAAAEHEARELAARLDNPIVLEALKQKLESTQ